MNADGETQIEIKKKGGKKMEMQSILTQMLGAITTNSTENNIGSQKVERKSGAVFQDYMSSVIKQNESAVVKKQNVGNEDNITTDVPTKQNVKNTETPNDLSAATGKTEQEEVDTQEVQILKRYEEDDTADNNLEDSFVVQPVVHEWKEEVQEMLCEEFNLTQEELEKIMLEMGMQFVDLQNLSNIQQFVLAVAGIDDKTELLTNEVLADQVISVDETMKQITTVLMQEYEMSDEEITNYLLQDAQLDGKGSLVAAGNVLPTEEGYQSEITDWKGMVSNEKVEMKMENFHGISQHKLSDAKLAEDNLIQQENVADTDAISVKESAIKLVESNAVDMKKTETPAEKEAVLTTFDADEEKVEPKIEITVKKAEEHLQEGKKEFSDSDKRQDSHGLFEHFVENLSVNRVNNVPQPDMKIDAIAQMREIVTQVVEQIKVRVNVDTTSMEVQLNPENLGKVNLTVVAKEGHITAQFVTENEIAKQALESQVQQLKDNLGEQGLKVDKVEVSVSNFDFSHSNQANTEEQRQQHSQEQRKVQRNLNLNDSVNLNDLTEEEQLAARIMTDNGNQVDYTV